MSRVENLFINKAARVGRELAGNLSRGHYMRGSDWLPGETKQKLRQH